MENYKTEKEFLSKISDRNSCFEFVDDSDLLKLLSEHKQNLIDTGETSP